MKAKSIVGGLAAVTLALTPIAAQAQSDPARAGAVMAEANEQSEEFSLELTVGVVFLLIVIAIVIFADDGGRVSP
jgi:hypothetical protein